MENKLQTTGQKNLSTDLRSELVRCLTSSDFKSVSDMLPKTIEKAIGQPPISSLVRSVGADVLQLQVEYELTILSGLVSVGGNLTNFSIPFVAEQMILNYPNESLADFKLCFQRGAMGAYGNIQRLDGVTIGVWFKEYLDEKYKVVEDMLMSEKESQYTIYGTPDNLYVKEKPAGHNALPIEQAQPIIEEWLKSVSEVGKMDVRDDLKKPEPVNRSTSYQPNPEYAIRRIKEIEWMKEMFHPVTKEKVEDFLSFEEWLQKGR